MTKEKRNELRELCEEVDASFCYHAYSEAVQPQVILELLAQIEALEARRVEISEEEIEKMAIKYDPNDTITDARLAFEDGFRAALAMVRGE